MEVNHSNSNIKKTLKRWLIVLPLVLLCNLVSAQPPIKAFVVKKGKIYVTFSKDLPGETLDEFIEQYDLQELDLKTFVKTNRPDSLHKLGWDVELNNGEMIVLAKAMRSDNKSPDAAEKIMLAQKHFDDLNSFANKEPVYGFNRFKKKSPFAVRDSLVTFFFPENLHAEQVMLAGTFNNWDPTALAMKRVDTGWIAVVKLAPGKHYYKFIVDGKWTIDKDNELVENDGRGNNNSVYYKSNYV